MNTGYNWKENDQIDPSFARPAGDFVVTRPGNSDNSPDTLHQNLVGNLSKDERSGAISNSVHPMATGTSAVPVISAPHESKEERKGRRIVSDTKRAAQNRNAQKAFRVRKEKYLKELEATAAEVSQLQKTIEELRLENLQLRDYTLALQSRLIELSPNVTMATHLQAPDFPKM